MNAPKLTTLCAAMLVASLAACGGKVVVVAAGRHR